MKCRLFITFLILAISGTTMSTTRRVSRSAGPATSDRSGDPICTPENGQTPGSGPCSHIKLELMREI